MAVTPLAKRESKPAGNAQEIEVELLLYFTAVAEELSFTRAAMALAIDQSWLSHKIRQLEAKLEVELFIRNTRHVQLTEAGEALLEPAARLKRAALDARNAALCLRNGADGFIRLGALPFSFRDLHRETLITAFTEQHPRIELMVANGTTPALLAKVRGGEIDAAIVSAPFEMDGLEALLLGEDEYRLMAPAGDPLAALPTLSFEDLRGRRIVMPQPSFSPAAFAMYYGPFLEAGAIHVAPPEFQLAAEYAVRWGLPVICKAAVTGICREAGYATLTLPGKPVRCRKYLVRTAGTPSPPLRALWASARALTGRGELAAAPARAVA